MSTLDEILWFLRDGKWHNLRETIEKSSSSKLITEMAFTFLRKYSFIQIDKNGREAKLRPSVLNFINEIQLVEKEETQVIRALRLR